MCVIDSYLLYTACIGRQESPDTYYSKLGEELIDSRKITRVQQELMARADEAEAGTKRQSLGTASGVGPHLTPNKRKKPSPGKEAGKGGKEFTNHTSQVRCMTCKTKTTWLCSLCIDVGKTRGVCHTKLVYSAGRRT